MKKTDSRLLAKAGVIGALYFLLTLLSNFTGLSSGLLFVQVRLSEMLCVLPAFSFAAVPGLFAGCLLSNLLLGGTLADVIFGSLATLIGAFGTYFFRKNRFWSLLPPIVANTLIIPFVLVYSYGVKDAFWYVTLSVFIGEFISAGVLGYALYPSLKRIGIE